ncbi:MAG TPA: CapA family protein [Ignavibacteriaceae bacterium]|nr:CapA family protein [Ignavibacteriaceae bacterium]
MLRTILVNYFMSSKYYFDLGILSALIFYFFLPFNRLVFSGEQVNENFPDDSVVTVTITAVGDIMCHSVQYNYARTADDRFDFNPVYRELKKYLINSDFLFGNFETVTAGKSKGYSGYPFFNTPDDFVAALKNAGFNLLTTSNNHSFDQGEKGLLRTIDIMNKNGLNYNGTFSSKKDRDSIRIFNIKGIKIAFLAYTFGTNGNPIPKGKSYLINLIDLSLIENDIKTARIKGAEIVLVHYHFGEEYSREPSDSQKEIVRETIEFGADIIIGGHPHVLQPADYYKTSNAGLDSGFVVYSMGNFISNQRWRYSDAGVILNIHITKNFRNDSIYISKTDYIPTWVFKGTTDRNSEYVIIPVLPDYKSSIADYFSKGDINSMMHSFDDCNSIFTKYTRRIKLFEEQMIIVNIRPRGYEHPENSFLGKIPAK